MNWFSGWLYPNDQNNNFGMSPISDEQTILQNHQHNMNIINMVHEEKMKALDKKYEKEKNIYENKYRENMSKLEPNNNNIYYYSQSNQSLYPNTNTNYQLKNGTVGILYHNNVNKNNKIEINPNLSKEEKRK